MENSPAQVIPLTDYLSFNAHEQSRMLVEKYGLPKVQPKDYKDLRRKMSFIAKTYKDEAFVDFAKIHPDAELLQQASEVTMNDEVDLNACGCSHFGGAEKKKSGCKCGGNCGDGDKESNFNEGLLRRFKHFDTQRYQSNMDGSVNHASPAQVAFVGILVVSGLALFVSAIMKA